MTALKDKDELLRAADALEGGTAVWRETDAVIALRAAHAALVELEAHDSTAMRAADEHLQLSYRLRERAEAAEADVALSKRIIAALRTALAELREDKELTESASMERVARDALARAERAEAELAALEKERDALRPLAEDYCKFQCGLCEPQVCKFRLATAPPGDPT